VAETAAWTTAKIAAIRLLQRIYSRELVDTIFELPYCLISNLIERDIAARQTVSVYFKELVKAGVLEERVFGREKLFIHSKLTQLLTSEKNILTPYS